MNLIKFLNKEKLLVVVILFFVLYRTYFTLLLFNERDIPPEPDDSYFYLAASSKFPKIESFEEFRLFYFSAWLKILSIFTNNNLEKAYFLNFLIGPLIIIFPIVIFLKRLLVNYFAVSIAILTLAFYTGSGAYHGLYWVVPSYYQLAAFFLLTAVLISKKSDNPFIYLTTIFLFIFSHPSSLLISLIFIIFQLFELISNKQHLKHIAYANVKFILTLFIVGIVYILISKLFNDSGSPQSVDSGLDIVKSFFIGSANPVSWSVIKKEYFSYIMLNPATFSVFLFMLINSFFYKKKLFYLFISALIVTVISIYIPYGSRSLAFLWPLTYILFAHLLFNTLLWFKESKLTVFFIAIIFLTFSVVSTGFSSVWIKSLNTNKNYSWNRECAYLTRDNSFYTSLEAKYAFFTWGKGKNQYFLINPYFSKEVNSSSKIIFANHISKKDEKLTSFEKRLSSISRRETPSFYVPDIEWTKSSLRAFDIADTINKKKLAYNSTINCGYYKILTLKNR